MDLDETSAMDRWTAYHGLLLHRMKGYVSGDVETDAASS